MPWADPLGRRKQDAKRWAEIFAHPETFVPCACGCGTAIPPVDARHRPHRYSKGHQPRPASRVGDSVASTRTTRMRAHAIKGFGPCELVRIGGCSSRRIEVHHIDGNPRNNRRGNLLRVCVTHHQLVERGYVSLKHPVMPQPYVYPSGRTIWPNNRQYPYRLLPKKRKAP